MRNDKFLVEFVNQLTKKDLFIAVWLLGAALFVYLMWSYNKRVTRRNFREDRHPLKKTTSLVSTQSKTNQITKETK